MVATLFLVVVDMVVFFSAAAGRPRVLIAFAVVAALGSADFAVRLGGIAGVMCVNLMKVRDRNMDDKR